MDTDKEKFIEEAKQVWDTREPSRYWDHYLAEATGLMLGQVTSDFQVSPEAIGVAKVMKLAVRLQEFHEKNKAENRVWEEKLNYVKDILDAFIEK